MSNERFVPIEELAKHFTVSVSTIRSWVRQGHIPADTYIKVGNTYRFSVSSVASALTSVDSEPQNESVIDESIDEYVYTPVEDDNPQLELDLDNDL